MEYWTLLGAILCGWAVLRILGGERESQLRILRAEAEAERRAREAEAAEKAAGK